jgi:hypothetical protein
MPGMGRFPHYVVVAVDVVPRGRRPIPQTNEGVIAVRRFDRKSVKKMLSSGHINAQATAAALVVTGWLDGGPAARRSSST